MAVLGIESSCDETSVAVVQGGKVLSNAVSSQIAIHAEYGGVVPELAVRQHLRNLLPLARTALAESGFRPSQLDAVAATRGPGLPMALLMGLKAGQALAFALGKPFFGVHHHEAHLYSAWIRGQPTPQAEFDKLRPNVTLVVSGGHTLLVHVLSLREHRLLGSTVDDAAGECFDKTAKLLGLPYPGGPAMDKLAADGDPSAFTFPRPMVHEPHDDFSFSGLKTSVRYFLRDRGGEPVGKDLADLCASVQAAIVDVLVKKTLRAAKRLRVDCVTASGGVTCNRALRRDLSAACARAGIELRLASPALCTDNAAMVAALAEARMAVGCAPGDLDADIEPSWSLETVGTR